MGAGTGADEAKDGTYDEGISEHARIAANAGTPSGWFEAPPRRDTEMVAGGISATAPGATRQHVAASNDAEDAGESMGHASQLEPANGASGDAIGIGQTSRSPARGAAPVATSEIKRRRLAVRRIMSSNDTPAGAVRSRSIGL